MQVSRRRLDTPIQMAFATTLRESQHTHLTARHLQPITRRCLAGMVAPARASLWEQQ